MLVMTALKLGPPVALVVLVKSQYLPLHKNRSKMSNTRTALVRARKSNLSSLKPRTFASRMPGARRPTTSDLLPRSGRLGVSFPTREQIRSGVKNPARNICSSGGLPLLEICFFSVPERFLCLARLLQKTTGMGATAMQDLSRKTVREIAVAAPAATRVFEEFKIDFCCAGQ